MASYQELFDENERLKRTVVELKQKTLLLEGSTPLVLARRFDRYSHWGRHLLRFALFANRIRRNLYGIPPNMPAPDVKVPEVAMPVEGLDPARETVLLVSHDASQTGAPILAWNIARALKPRFNVVVVLIDGGVLMNSFDEVAAAVVGPLGSNARLVPNARKFAIRLVETYKPLFVIANTAESRYLAAPLAQEKVPVVSLIHEFAAGLFPKDTMQRIFDWSADIVFPAAVVRDSFMPGYKSLPFKRIHILPQGQSIVPEGMHENLRGASQPTPDELRLKLRPPGAKDALLVVAMGPADFRKGADLFVATAQIARRLAPDVRFRWAWVGSAHDPVFHSYLGEQMYRSGLQDEVALIPTLNDIAAVYAAADVLYVCSRLDPLPNVAIDMALAGKPVVCFDEATGFAEILSRRPETAGLVAPHLDTARAAEILIDLARHREMLKTAGTALQATARATFRMPDYVAQIVELGRAAASERTSREDDKALLLQPGNFDVPLYLGHGAAATVGAEDAVDHYLNYADAIAVFRRALAGFHPGLYAEHSTEVHKLGYADPLIHYISAGRPEGVWSHPVIRLDSAPAAVREGPAAALHGHFFYTDNIGDFRTAMAANKGRYDVFLTTGSEAKRDELRAAMQGFAGRVEIDIVPNLGRDIGPFLHVLRTRISGRYDLVGHVHGKRSVHAHSVGASVGDIWRIFLWQHLLGPKTAAADRIVAAMAGDAKLGLVFPEDPAIVGWDHNLPYAEDLARRMQLKEPLPKCLDFPVGTMFWARPEALEPLLRLDLEWADYPPEPLPLDGSMLHAMERIIPSVARDAGYHFATTYLPGVGR